MIQMYIASMLRMQAYLEQINVEQIQYSMVMHQITFLLLQQKEEHTFSLVKDQGLIRKKVFSMVTLWSR